MSDRVRINKEVDDLINEGISMGWAARPIGGGASRGIVLTLPGGSVIKVSHDTVGGQLRQQKRILQAAVEKHRKASDPLVDQPSTERHNVVPDMPYEEPRIRDEVVLEDRGVVYERRVWTDATIDFICGEDDEVFADWAAMDEHITIHKMLREQQEELARLMDKEMGEGDDLSEDDESVEELIEKFDFGEQGVTTPPRKRGRNTPGNTAQKARYLREGSVWLSIQVPVELLGELGDPERTRRPYLVMDRLYKSGETTGNAEKAWKAEAETWEARARKAEARVSQLETALGPIGLAMVDSQEPNTGQQ